MYLTKILAVKPFTAAFPALGLGAERASEHAEIPQVIDLFILKQIKRQLGNLQALVVDFHASRVRLHLTRDVQICTWKKTHDLQCFGAFWSISILCKMERFPL